MARENIIIYGIGTDFSKNKKAIEDKYNIIGYIDKCKSDSYGYRNILFSKLADEEFDFIMITSERHFVEMYNKLLAEGISKEKIIGCENSAMYQIISYIDLHRKGTSITDETYYPFVCKAASENEEIFRDFKRNPIYTQALEHVSYEQGLEYLKCIEASVGRTDFSLSAYEEFIKNDLYGTPNVFSYLIKGKEFMLSPTTLRYIKVLSDLCLLFDMSKIKQITEIGVGYGGQCRINLSYLANVEKYLLIDLEEVIGLTKKFMSKYPEYDKVVYIDGTSDFDNCFSDLVISNYAFSELRREVQKMYLEKVILNSKSGYMTMNVLGERKYNSYSKEELLDLIPNAKIISEEPLTYEGNYVIYWTPES